MFRNQNHLTREQMVTFAERFGEVGEQFGEREHRPNSPHDLNQQVKVKGIPNMLVLPSDETVPNAAFGLARRRHLATAPAHGVDPDVPGSTGRRRRHLLLRLPRDVGGTTLGGQTARRAPDCGPHRRRGAPDGWRHAPRRASGCPDPPGDRAHDALRSAGLRAGGSPTNTACTEDEQKSLLWRMKLQEGRPEYTCRFRWEPGSIAMWDNRCDPAHGERRFLAASPAHGAADDPRLRRIAADALLRPARGALRR